jgi:hypothetical protein
VAVSVVLMAISACDNENENNDEPFVDDSSAPGVEEPGGLTVRGEVWSVAGQPLANVAVVAKTTTGTATVTSDAQGRYQLRLPEGDVVIRFAKADYVGTIKRVTVSSDYATMLHVKLLKADRTHRFQADEGGTFFGTDNNGNGVVSVTIPEDAFIDANGELASGELSVQLTNIDPSDDNVNEAAPGFIAINEEGIPVQLESGGMLEIDVRSSLGEKLQLGGGKTLTVKFPVAKKLSDLYPDDDLSMPLWSFNEETAQWNLEGGGKEITPAEESDGFFYTAELPHMSFWNMDKPMSAVCVSGCAKDKGTGEPLAGAQVVAKGIDYVGSSASTTGADGCFRLSVRRSSKVNITVQHKLGGGITEEVYTWGSPVLTRVFPNHTDTCQPVLQESLIEKDTFNYGGLAAGCSSMATSPSGNSGKCLEEFGRMFACAPMAGCSTVFMGVGRSIIRWDSGSRMEVRGTEGTAYGPSGQKCFDYSFDIDQPTNTLTFVYTDATGKIFKIEIAADRYSVECSSGEKFALNTALSACQEQANPDQTNSCSEKTVFRDCQSRFDCREENLVCCDVLSEASRVVMCMTEGQCTASNGTWR